MGVGNVGVGWDNPVENLIGHDNMTMDIMKNQKTIPAGEFKSQCLKLMDVVQRTRKPITITKRGKPIVKLAPLDSEEEQWFGRLKGKVNIVGDIESPIDPPEIWESSR